MANASAGGQAVPTSVPKSLLSGCRRPAILAPPKWANSAISWPFVVLRYWERASIQVVAMGFFVSFQPPHEQPNGPAVPQADWPFADLGLPGGLTADCG